MSVPSKFPLTLSKDLKKLHKPASRKFRRFIFFALSVKHSHVLDDMSLLCIFGVIVLVMNFVHANHNNTQKCSNSQHVVGVIGGVIDQSSRVGREQQIAMEMAVRNFCRITNNSCSCPFLYLRDSQTSLTRSVYKGM